ncbi:MAG TPA: GNAT family N-acetyltransferase [Fimbriimonadaceae bacterium]|nr:GNAT family N-acetyltransferase [Fimbriimonadaceae bacterium]
MESTIQIRPMRLEDVAEVARFYHDIRMDTVPLIHSENEVAEWISATLLPRNSSFVGELIGAVIGWVDVTPMTLDHLYLRRGLTGQGFGRLLLDFAKQRSPEGLELYTFQVNSGAFRFYEREGFVETKRGDGSGNEEGEPDIKLVWKQPRPPTE